MTEKCPVCKNNIKSNDNACSVCGFTDLHREFITKEDGELWVKQVVEPYKKEWNSYEPQEIRDLRIRANSGDSDAQNILGRYYQNGRGVPKDINMAIYYYEKAIENGSGVAAHNLACVYDKVTTEYPNDYNKALKYYRMAEERGFSSGALFNNLGRLYGDGKGVETNYEVAKKYYEKAISMGNDTARNNLNMLLAIELEKDARNDNDPDIGDVSNKSGQVNCRLQKSSNNEPNFIERNSNDLGFTILGVFLILFGVLLFAANADGFGGFLGFVAMLGGIFFVVGSLSSLH